MDPVAIELILLVRRWAKDLPRRKDWWERRTKRAVAGRVRWNICL